MRPVVARRVGALVIAVGLLGSLAVTPVLGASIVVNSLADGAPADDGICTLREAITAANDDLASGVTAGECGAGSGADAITFSVAGMITLASALPFISSDLSINGAGVITVSGASAYRVFLIDVGTVTLSGLTITAGFASGGAGILNSQGTLTVTNSTISGNGSLGGGNFSLEGGGILNLGASLTVTNSTISGNTANTGGGIYNFTGTVTITSSTISGNTAPSVCGGIFSTNGTLTVTNSTISGNTANAGSGGGICDDDGTLTVTNSTISGNTASLSAGGILDGGTATITNSTISGNTATDGDGGGIFSINGTLTVTNSTISGNTANGNSQIAGHGGGMYQASGFATVTNATISGNTASVSGGGIRAGGTETLVNDIVAGNTGPIGPDIDLVAETITTSVIGVPGGKTLADILVPAGLADNGGPTQTIALALVAGNPAIDLGTSAVCAAAPVNALDQRGLPRPAACDIGAYEAQPPTVAAHANVSVPATSAAGAVVTYIPPAGTNEQGGVAAVVCLPASGSTFAPGTTTVTCTATDAVGHTGTGTFQVVVSAFVAATATPSPTPTPSPAATPSRTATVSDTSAADETTGAPSLPLVLGVFGLLSLTALWHREVARRRRS
jgi:CSLREA domain-containing protein